jgi:voltage-gated potassium channel Kch
MAFAALCGALPTGAQGYFLKTKDAEQLANRRAAELTARLVNQGAYDYSLDTCRRVSGRRILCTTSIFFKDQTCRQPFDIRYPSARSRQTMVGTLRWQCLHSQFWHGFARSPRRPTPVVLFDVSGDRLEQFFVSRVDVPCNYWQDEPMGIARKGKFKAIPIVDGSVSVRDSGPGWDVTMHADNAGFRFATALNEEGFKVVAIEPDQHNPAIQGCRERGIGVMKGDATDPSILRAARVDRADRLVVTCGDDGRNIDVATAARRRYRGTAPRRCDRARASRGLRPARDAQGPDTYEPELGGVPARAVQRLGDGGDDPARGARTARIPGRLQARHDGRIRRRRPRPDPGLAARLAMRR